MFTGIIAEIGSITLCRREGDHLLLGIAAPKLLGSLAIGDSVSISGVCLTVTGIARQRDVFSVTAVDETLKRTTLRQLRQGSRVNLELALAATDRFGGHFVQGHIDATGRCLSVSATGESRRVRFSFPAEQSHLLIEKGSIAVDGVSLTCYDSRRDSFSVSLVPHTLATTTLSELRVGDEVNLEFDILGKYLARYAQLRGVGAVTASQLEEMGY